MASIASYDLFASFYAQLCPTFDVLFSSSQLQALPRQYVDACKIVKGLEPKFGYFVTKAAEAPKAVETAAVVEEVKPDKAKKAASWGKLGWG